MKLALVATLAWLATATACATERPERWDYIYSAIIVPSCTTSACHSELSVAGNLALHDDAAAYESLTGRKCGDATTPVTGYVDVMNPTSSLLSGLLRREGPTGMPPNGRLADIEIELFESWMSRGAPCD